ncbi:unnamed protein product, partial [Coregonus sp. 'balchen']
VHFINLSDPNLKFTAERSREKIDFLDLTIHKNKENKLESTNFRKPQSRNTLLCAYSNHPVHLKQNILVGQFLRLRSNYSPNIDFERKARFLQSGYDKGVIEQAYTRARETERQSLLTGTNRNQDKMRPQYSPCTGRVKSIVLKHWNILKSDQNLREFTALPPCFCF